MVYSKYICMIHPIRSAFMLKKVEINKNGLDFIKKWLLLR